MTREDLSKVPTPADDKTEVILPVISAGSGAEAAGGGEDGPESDEDVEARLAYESLMRHRKARRRKKIIAASVVGGVVVVAGIVWAVVNGAGSSQPETPPLSTIPVFRSEFSESVQATGAAQPLSSVAVTPEVDGIVSEVHVAEGDTVEEGQTLLVIKNDELDKAVRDSELAVRKANTALATAKSSRDNAYTAYCAAYNIDPSSEDTAQTLAAYQAAKDEVTGAQYGVEDANEVHATAVAQAAKRTITAPSAGSVVSMKAVAGESVGASMGSPTSGGSAAGSLIQIADLSMMTVKVQVNEVDISKISVGQTARVTFSALPGVMLDAEVTRISTVSSSNDQYGMNYGVVTYDVELLIAEPVPELKPGMTASVEIMMQHVPDALTVPVQALATDDGTNYYVYVMTDPETQACERRDVTLGAQSSTTAVVESGLSEGDAVVLDPFAVQSFSDGGGGSVAPDAVAPVPEDGTVDEGGTADEGGAVAEDVPATGSSATTAA